MLFSICTIIYCIFRLKHRRFTIFRVLLLSAIFLGSCPHFRLFLRTISICSPKIAKPMGLRYSKWNNLYFSLLLAHIQGSTLTNLFWRTRIHILSICALLFSNPNLFSSDILGTTHFIILFINIFKKVLNKTTSHLVLLIACRAYT